MRPELQKLENSLMKISEQLGIAQEMLRQTIIDPEKELQFEEEQAAYIEACVESRCEQSIQEMVTLLKCWLRSEWKDFIKDDKSPLRHNTEKFIESVEGRK